MVHPKIRKLVQEVFAAYGKERAGKDPEAFLFSLLKCIKEELPVVSAILQHTVHIATFDRNLKEARRSLNRVKTKPEFKEVSRVRTTHRRAMAHA